MQREIDSDTKSEIKEELGFKTLKSKQVIVYSYCTCPKEERREGSIQGVRDNDF